MHYTQTISSPLGNILLSADEVGLTGLWFDGGRYYADTLPEEHVERETPILMDTKRWLDVYFTGHEPDFTPLLHPTGSPFRQAVWQLRQTQGKTEEPEDPPEDRDDIQPPELQPPVREDGVLRCPPL